MGFCGCTMFCCALLCVHLDGEERACCFALVVFLVPRDCCVALPDDATVLSAVCVCGISSSYSLTIFEPAWVQCFNGLVCMEIKVSKSAKIRNPYNQVPHLTQDTNGKVTNSQLDTTNESHEVSPFPAGDHKAHLNRRAQRHKDSCMSQNSSFMLQKSL